MKILLPPSEGKTPPAHDGTRLNLDSLTLPELAGPRTQVAEALIQASTREDAQKVLKVGAKVMEEVKANTAVWEAPTAPAHQIYTGVLFDALEPGSLTVGQRARAADQILIFSGLFGATGFDDPIPAHRLAMDVKLPELGNLGAFWKKQLKEPLEELVADQLVVDCRSSSYTAAFRPPQEQTLMVNNFTEKHGQRKVVTHFAKHARGLLTGMLLRAVERPKSIDDVATLAAERWTVEIRPAEGRKPHQLDLISQA